jgi:hypothetical protein
LQRFVLPTSSGTESHFRVPLTTIRASLFAVVNVAPFDGERQLLSGCWHSLTADNLSTQSGLRRQRRVCGHIQIDKHVYVPAAPLDADEHLWELLL